MLDYAIVVATRNRLDMLHASLPIFVNQSRPANRVVVVDRSDDHESVRSLCESIAANAPMPFEVVYGSEANLPAQRNQGLESVREAVTIFPDDDVLWYPDTAERFMEVYEADKHGRYGAVSGTEVHVAPPGVDVDIPERRERLTNRPAVMRVRNRLEEWAVPQPFNVFGRDRTVRLAPAARADGLGYPLVETIGGYRMSFRTEVARALQFDRVLGSKIGYATHEDKDMGLRVLAEGMLIAASPAARVFHNVHPGKRTGGFSYGFFHILNYFYICKKVFPAESRAMRATRRYLDYKVFLYSLRRGDEYSRDIHAGARAAMTEYGTMMSTPPEGLAARYAEICARQF